MLQKSKTEKLRGVYRLKLDLMVVCDDVDKVLKSIRVTAVDAAFKGAEVITLRGTDGWVNPAWKVVERNGRVTVELKRKRGKTAS
jgi:hypothetical protein